MHLDREGTTGSGEDRPTDHGSEVRGHRIRVTLTPSGHTSEAIRQSPELPVSLRRALARLVTHEREVIAWLAQDPSRPGRFLADPVAALRASDLPLPADLLAELDRTLADVRRHEVVPADLRIQRADVTVAPGAAPPRRGDDPGVVPVDGEVVVRTKQEGTR